jgi:hypothetical protein
MLRDAAREGRTPALGRRGDGRPDRPGAITTSSPRTPGSRLKPRKFNVPKYLAAFKGASPPGASAPPSSATSRAGRILKDDAIDELATQAADSTPTAINRLRSRAEGVFSGQQVSARICSPRSSEALTRIRKPTPRCKIDRERRPADQPAARRGHRAAQGPAQGPRGGRRRRLQAARHGLGPREDRQRRRGRCRRPARAGAASCSAPTRFASSAANWPWCWTARGCGSLRSVGRRRRRRADVRQEPTAGRYWAK